MFTQEDNEFVERLSERTESIGINLDRDPVQEYQYKNISTRISVQEYQYRKNNH